MNVEDTTRCANCHEEFANHNYVADSITKYKCPHPHQETFYGHFCGGDPRNFHPDHESCMPHEIANHDAACELADQLEREGNPVDWKCPSGFERWGGHVVHVLRAPFGIGTAVMEEDQFFEAADDWRESVDADPDDPTDLYEECDE